jgi:hypothetical protein
MLVAEARSSIDSSSWNIWFIGMVKNSKIQRLLQIFCTEIESNKTHSVQLLHFSHCHTVTQSHWSNWSTVCFPPQGAADRSPGVQLHFWNWNSPISVVSQQSQHSCQLVAEKFLASQRLEDGHIFLTYSSTTA